MLSHPCESTSRVEQAKRWCPSRPQTPAASLRSALLHAAAKPPSGTHLARPLPSIFFRLHPRRLSILGTIESLTRTFATFSRNSRRSQSVSEGRSSMSVSKSLLALSSILGLEPRRFLGASGLPSSQSIADRLTEERLTPKKPAASLSVVP